MASTSTQQLSSGGTPGPQSSSRPRDWVRSGEPGSAFNGLSRGRGRGRGNNGRVPRGGRGSARVKPAADTTNGPTPATLEVSTPPTNVPAPPIIRAPLDLPIPSPVPPASPSMSKAKATSRRPSRTVPSLVVDPSPPTPAGPSDTINTPRTPNRRNRSQQHKPTNPTSPDKLAVPDIKPARPRKSRPNVPPLLSSKDAPPHLNTSAGPGTANFDMKHDIDALVERVRAVAMAENRPTTPGSHIDWAGDEDDTLPDLDDWGVTTGPNTATALGASMSPISVGGLTPLPEPTEQPPVVSEATQDSAPATTVPVINVVEVVRNPTISDGGHPPSTLSETNNGRSDGRQASTSSPTSGQPIPEHLNSTSPNTRLPVELKPREATTTVSDPPRTPLHPSLPPKPVAAVESLLIQSKSRAGGIVVRLPNSAKSPTPVTTNLSVGVVDPIDSSKSCPEETSQPSSPQRPSGYPQDPTTKQSQGLSASIHAPHNFPESSLSPMISLPSSNPLHPFRGRPIHHRSHTVGRSPQITPTAPFPTTITHSGSSTPQGRYSPSRNSHMRTHSSPADSPSSHRSPHATRPVITGDALSKLARTICNTSPTRTVAIAVSKN